MERGFVYTLLSASLISLMLCGCSNTEESVLETVMTSSSESGVTVISESVSESEVSLETTESVVDICAPSTVEDWTSDDCDYKHEYIAEFLDPAFESQIDTSTSGWWDYNDNMTGSSVYHSGAITVGYSLTVTGDRDEIYYAYYGPELDLLYSAPCSPREYTSFTSYDLDIAREGDWKIGQYYLLVSSDPDFSNIIFRASFEIEDVRDIEET
ncbi:MAG: hypothetical protein K5745_06285 [Saccharofermentans sp.]|nr:hypothetical protein [Saccharofermentans sp.]